MRWSFLAFAVLSGCRTETPSQTPKPAAMPSQECAPLAAPAEVIEAYERGVAALEASRDGEHLATDRLDVATQALLFAAENGHLDAQSVYGRTVFSVHFMARAPTPEDKEAYLSSLAFLRIAARSGDQLAFDFLPGLMAEAEDLEEPLSSLPEGWVAEAFARADAWVTCYGEPSVRAETSC